jgi:hypothetical protein
MMRQLIMCGTALFSIADASIANCEEAFMLRLPVNCELGRNCFVQNYVDRDPSGNIRDFSCGRRTYNGHDGLDFRIPDMAAQRKGVEVLAAAPGRLLRMRDGIDDVLGKVSDKVASAGRECGNGVVIEHQGGWTTQYCHMAKHSIRGKLGDNVEAGQLNGTVTRISGDAVKDDRSGPSYYRVGISISQTELAKLEKLSLVPGMPVECYIRTGDRTVLSYITKPLEDHTHRVFRDK